VKLDNMNLSGSMGSALTLRQTEVQKTSVLKSVSDTYTEHAKIVFLFDVSGSMGMRVAADKTGQTYTDQYLWPAALLADVRTRVAAAINEFIMSGGMGCNESDLLKLVDDAPVGAVNAGPAFNPKDDEDLKARILRTDLIAYLGVAVDFSKKHQQPPTRLELVRKLAKSELQARFAKFPNSRVAVIPFASTAEVRFDDGKPEQLWPIVGNLAEGLGGGTDILKAIKKGVDCCRKHPSVVGLHHFILVTDGEDGSASMAISSWVPNLKASGIVLDYIHIGEEGCANAELRAACVALGGEYCVVNSEREFEAKFVEAVHRKLLPPPTNS
jgi:Mg-chelatase subunit ChlD